MAARTGDFGQLLGDGRKWFWWTVVIGNCFISLYSIWLLFEVTLKLSIPSEPQLIRGIEFVIYLISWTWGLACDVSAQRRAYATDKPFALVPSRDVVVVACIVLAGAFLFVTIKGDKWFAAGLTIFFAINLVSWNYFTKKVRPIICSLRSEYSDHQDKMVRLDIIESYLFGRWQIRRFFVMFLLLLFADTVCLSVDVRNLLATHIQRLFSVWSQESISTLLPEFALGLFMLVAECWSWSKRLPVYLATRDANNTAFADSRKVQNSSYKRGDPKGLRSHMDRSFRRKLKLPVLLWAAHGAAFSIIKGVEIANGNNPLPINPLQYFAAISLPGIAYAAFGYVALMIVHENIMDSFYSDAPTPVERRNAYRKALGDMAVSLALLFIPPLVLMARPN